MTLRGSKAIDRLVAIAQAEGNMVTTEASEASVVHTMAKQMSDAVDEAGGSDDSLSYLQSFDATVPTEGYIDEANNAIIVFPLRAEVAQPAPSLQRQVKSSWFATLLPAILCFAGAAQLLLAFVQGQGTWLRPIVGILLLVSGLLLWRKRRTTSLGRASRSDDPPMAT